MTNLLQPPNAEPNVDGELKQAIVDYRIQTKMLRPASSQEVMMIDVKPQISTLSDTFFGERAVVFVKYPSTWSVQEMITKLDWAKTWDVKEMGYEQTVVQAFVKPKYLENFRRDNDQHIVLHKKLPTKDPEDELYEVEHTLYGC